MLRFDKQLLAACIFIVFAVSAGAGAADSAQSDSATAVASSPIVTLLSDNLGAVKATDAVKMYSADTLEPLVGNGAPVYREYKVLNAGARTYGDIKVEIFQCDSRSGAFGLFSSKSGLPVATAAPDNQLSSSSNFASDGLIFWRGSLFVRIEPASPNGAAGRAALTRVATALSVQIGSAGGAQKLPTLIQSLPQQEGVQPKARYFLGPAALGDFLPHAGEMFSFGGEAEAVLSQYNQEGKSAEPLSFLIVEYNTPQFAHEALDHATGFLSQLKPEEQDQIVLKRIGNYLVEASGVTDRTTAERLVDQVKYPYTVKWFQVPFHRKEDPHAGQKAAQILLSSFGIIALLLGSALMGGGIFGAIIFVKRRQRQRGVFSDAGGMLRLDIEELCVGASARALPAAGHASAEDKTR